MKTFKKLLLVKEMIDTGHLSTDIKLSKTQLCYKMIQSGGFLGRLLGPLLKTRQPL